MEGISIYYMDNTADGIVSSLNELLKSGLLGGSLAVLVLFFFLRRLSTTLIVALAVPFSLLITMAFMYFMGLSLNILTMMGLMLAVGMLVDNAVVVTESIHRHQIRNHSQKDSVRTGVSEVALAITAGTMTTAIVFLPNIVSPNDQISVYLKHVGLTICIALGASLLLAQTVVPLLASRTRPPQDKSKSTVVDKMLVYYGSALEWTLRHRRLSVGIILFVLASIALPISMVKMEMFDEASDRRLYLRYNIDGFYALDKVIEAVDIYEDYLFSHQKDFDIESVYTYYTGNYAMSTILLTKDENATRSMEDIKDAIKENLPRVPIADPTFGFRGKTGDEQSINVQLTGQSSEQLADLSRDVAWTLSQIDGLTDVHSGAAVGEEEVHVKVDRVRARQYGFTPEQIATVVSAAMRGVNLRRFRTEHGEIDVRLEFQDSDRQTLEQLQNLPLFNGGDQPVKLATLADFSVERGPREIERVNRVTSIEVTANLKNLTVGEAKEKIGRVLGHYNFPPGYSWSYGQSFDNEDEAFRTMLVNLLLALALIYFVMASIFESIVYPAAIWTQILFAIVGVYWFFLITGTTMSLMGMIGILILIGVVVNNGIVLIDHVNQLRAQGLERRVAILQAGQDRLRPILMTAGTTVLSLVPLCVVTTQIGGDGPPYFPMARAIVGGLAFSTAVTLLILPTIYILLDDLRAWSRKIVRLSR
jgi:HAE1 family hydrophobic/amphiphilic exporter-1